MIPADSSGCPYRSAISGWDMSPRCIGRCHPSRVPQTGVGVALPPRDYQLAGRLLADAVANSQATGEDVGSAVNTVARDAGHRIGAEMQERMGRRRSAKRSPAPRLTGTTLDAHPT